MERQVAALKDEIVKVQEEERAMAERAIQAVVSHVKLKLIFFLIPLKCTLLQSTNVVMFNTM